MIDLKELRKTHQYYSTFYPAWDLFYRSYFGGQIYLDGGYLIKLPAESEMKYAARRGLAYFFNYCRPIVNIYINFLMSKRVTRDFGRLAKDKTLEAFKQDVSYDGVPLQRFMRDAATRASYYGHVGIIVTKGSTIGLNSKQDEIDAGIRPYAYIVNPPDIYDWAYTREPNGRVRLTYLKIKESDDPERYRIYLPDRWMVYEVAKAGGQQQIRRVAGGLNEIREIPFVLLYNRPTDIRMIGLSDLNDIAYINKAIFNVASWDDEDFKYSCFNMLETDEKPPGQKTNPADDIVGVGVIKERDPDKPNSGWRWIEAPKGSAERAEKWFERRIKEIYRLAMMGGVVTGDTKQAMSGYAKTIDFQELGAAIIEKANNVEAAENAIFRLYARYQGEEWDGNIDYPDNFNVDDLATEIDNAIKAVTLQLGMTANQEIKKRIAKRLLPKLNPDKLKKIEDEIENQKVKPGE